MLTNFFVMAWSAWGRRNIRLYENKPQYPKLAFESALSTLSLFLDCEHSKAPNVDNIGCWQPLDPGVYKLNTDGAIFDDIQAVGYGAALQDHQGEVLLAVNFKDVGTQCPETMECLAIL